MPSVADTRTAGQVVPPAAYDVSDVTVMLSAQPVTVLGAALAPGLAGVYQIAIQIPAALADGDYPTVVAVAGAQSQSAMILSVHR